MVNGSDLKECGSKREAIETFIVFIGLVKKFVGQTATYGCPLPCKQTTYGLNLNYFHKNSWIETEEVKVNIFYKVFLLKKWRG
jgi:hypothetical protein